MLILFFTLAQKLTFNLAGFKLESTSSNCDTEPRTARSNKCSKSIKLNFTFSLLTKFVIK